MRADFARLDELLAKDENSLTEAEDEEFARLAPLFVDPAYQEHRKTLIVPTTPEGGERPTSRLLGARPKDEAEHFEVCPQCGQAIDARDLKEVLRHLQPGHEAATPDA